MSCTQKAILLATILALTVPLMVNGARPISFASNLKTRLKLDEEQTNCWDTLFELQACSGEIIMFFLNGETYLGPSCCEALRTIKHQCWPTMMSSLGFTTEESDVLEGYCDEAASHNSPPSTPSTLFTTPPPSPLSNTTTLPLKAIDPTGN